MGILDEGRTIWRRRWECESSIENLRIEETDGQRLVHPPPEDRVHFEVGPRVKKKATGIDGQKRRAGRSSLFQLDGSSGFVRSLEEEMSATLISTS